MTVQERFWTYVDKSGECWMWMGAKGRRGYGLFSGGEKRSSGGLKLMPAHRFSYAQFVASIPEGAVVMHKCDTPGCVRPGHLEAGTQSQNILDMFHKGRGYLAQGEKHYGHVLNDELVLSLRRRHAAGESMNSMAVALGFAPRTLRDAVKKVTWRHLEDQPGVAA